MTRNNKHAIVEPAALPVARHPDNVTHTAMEGGLWTQERRKDVDAMARAREILRTIVEFLATHEATLSAPLRVLRDQGRDRLAEYERLGQRAAELVAGELAAKNQLDGYEGWDDPARETTMTQLEERVAAAGRERARVDRDIAAVERQIVALPARIRAQGRKDYGPINKAQRAELATLVAPIAKALKEWEKTIVPHAILLCAVATRDFRDAQGLFHDQAAEAAMPEAPTPLPEVVQTAHGLVHALVTGGFLLRMRQGSGE